MTNTPAFDVLARDYDTQFTTSMVGAGQRSISRKWLLKLLQGKNKLNILEINCGTGADAIWMADMGHNVIATDQSPKMIAIAQAKITPVGTPEFLACAFDELGSYFSENEFDLVFSNFAGLNCVSPQQLQSIANQLHQLVRPGGHLAAVIFGKYCLWETMYYLSKGRPRDAFRRRTSEKVTVPLDAKTIQPVYFYSVKQFTCLLTPFKRIQTRPVGLFIPPSYLEGAMKKHPGFFRTLLNMEEKLGGMAAAGSLADHTWTLFKKENI
jgi:ubiquinone/menaquinone biosynthesis C-methylase UbiE